MKGLSYSSNNCYLVVSLYFADLSRWFAQSHALQIQDCKRTDNPFKVVKYSKKTFKKFVDRFEALKLFTNPDQFAAYTIFIKE